MSQFDMGPMGALLGGFQHKIEAAKQQAAATEVTGEAAGGRVKVVMTCDYQVQSVQIATDAYEDKDMLEDLVRAATNEALRQARAETAMRNAIRALPDGTYTNSVEADGVGEIMHYPIQITVEGDDGMHMAATVVDERFRDMNRVQQQRAVYAALKGKMDGSDGELHALQLTTRAPA